MAAFVRTFNITVLAALAGGIGFLFLNSQYALQQAGETHTASNTITASNGRQVLFAPPPDFVRERDLTDLPIEMAPAEGGVRIVLADTQHDATGLENAQYTRFVMRPETAQGVAVLAQFQIEYDPAYHRLEVNHVRVTRDGEVEDRRDRFAIDFAQREALLDQQILTGVETAIIRIGDMRPGDLVDIAATLFGAPEAFDGRAAEVFRPSSLIPIDTYALTSRWDRGTPWTMLGDGPEVIVRNEGGRMVLEIEPQPIAPSVEDQTIPPWYADWPIIVVSDFGTWEELVDWAIPLYAADPSPEVVDIAAEIANTHTGQAEQTMAALRYSQREIRYFATVLGNGGYVPTRTQETLRLRTGDCKAKTLLLLSLLDELGIDAHAVLVSTSQGRAIDQMPATPLAFDHVIVRVRLDGRDYWLDPTFSEQFGTLDRATQPDYGFALPVLPGVSDLIAMDVDFGVAPMVTVREAFDISAADGVIAIHVDYVQDGPAADEFRLSEVDVDNDAIRENMLAYYRQTYGEARLVGEPRLLDDLILNRIILSWDVEIGRIADAGDGEDETTPRGSFFFQAHAIQTVVPRIGEFERERPLAVAYPYFVRHETTINFGDSEGWQIPDLRNESILNEAFRFNVESSFDNNELRYVAELVSLSTEVAPDAVFDVLEDQSRIPELAYVEAWPDDGATRKTAP